MFCMHSLRRCSDAWGDRGVVRVCRSVCVCVRVSPPPPSGQEAASASSCPAHSWADSSAASWGRSSGRNPESIRSPGSAPCGGKWSLWWTWGGKFGRSFQKKMCRKGVLHRQPVSTLPANSISSLSPTLSPPPGQNAFPPCLDGNRYKE